MVAAARKLHEEQKAEVAEAKPKVCAERERERREEQEQEQEHAEQERQRTEQEQQEWQDLEREAATRERDRQRKIRQEERSAEAMVAQNEATKQAIAEQAKQPQIVPDFVREVRKLPQAERDKLGLDLDIIEGLIVEAVVCNLQIKCTGWAENRQHPGGEFIVYNLSVERLQVIERTVVKRWSEIQAFNKLLTKS